MVGQSITLLTNWLICYVNCFISKSLSEAQLDKCHEKGLEIMVETPKSKWQ